MRASASRPAGGKPPGSPLLGNDKTSSTEAFASVTATSAVASPSPPPLSSTARHTGTSPPPPSASAAAAQMLSASCSCPLESFVTVLSAPAATAPASGEPASAPARRGILRFIGPTDFADGLWAGVELVGAFGRNDGVVRGRKYFECLPGQGVFVRPELVKPLQADGGGSHPTAHTAAQDEEEREAAVALMAELESRLLDAEERNAALTSTVELLRAETQQQHAARDSDELVKVSQERARALESRLASLEATTAADAREWASKLQAEERARQLAEDRVAALSRDASGSGPSGKGKEEGRPASELASTDSDLRLSDDGAEKPEEAKGSVSASANELLSVRSELQSTAAALRAAEAQIASLTQAQEQQRTADQAAWEDASEKAAASLRELQSQRIKLEDQLTDAEEAKATLEAALAAAEQTARQKLSAAEAAFVSERQHHEAAVGRLTGEVERAKADAVAAVAAAEAAAHTARVAPPPPTERDAEELRSWKSKAAALEGQLSALAEAKATAVQAQEESLENARRVEHDNARLNAEKAELETALKAAVQTHTAKAEQQSEVDAVRRDLAALQCELAEAQASFDAERASLQTALRTAKTQVDKQEEIVGALEKERDELREFSRLQEDEMSADKAQSDQLSDIVNSLSAQLESAQGQWNEEKAQLESAAALHAEQLLAVQQETSKWRRQAQVEQERVRVLMQDAQRDRQAERAESAATAAGAEAGAEAASESDGRVVKLTEELDEARLQIFQLQKSMEAVSELQAQYDQLAAELDSTKRKAKKREEALTQDYEDALTHVRGYKDRAQSECAQLRAELAQLQQQQLAEKSQPHSTQDVHANGGTSPRAPQSSSVPLAQDRGIVEAADSAHVDPAADLPPPAAADSSPPPPPPAVLSDLERHHYEQALFQLQRRLLYRYGELPCSEDAAIAPGNPFSFTALPLVGGWVQQDAWSNGRPSEDGSDDKLVQWVKMAMRD